MRHTGYVVSVAGMVLLAKCWYDLMKFLYHREHLLTARAMISDVRLLLQPQFDAHVPHEDIPKFAARVLEGSGS